MLNEFGVSMTILEMKVSYIDSIGSNKDASISQMDENVVGP